MTVVGEGPRDHPALEGLDLPPLGWNRRIFVLSTPDLLFAAQMGLATIKDDDETVISLQRRHENDDPSLMAFNPDSGEHVATIPLPGNATGSPMTYSVDGKQYIVMAIGGADDPAELVALALP